ncbi:MAG: hypothetical protein II951_12590 [Bacteroidales bacterium]|nr:hypothetical protein [Bacteroidales bacterium]
MIKKIASLVLSLLMVQFAMAQYNNPRGRVPEFLLGLSYGGKVGATVYFGDLVDKGRARWTLGAFAEKQCNEWVYARLALDFGQCHGAQTQTFKVGYQTEEKPVLEFKTGFVNLQAIGKVQFLDLIGGYDDGRPFNPYFGIGIGGIFFNCKKHPVNVTKTKEQASMTDDQVAKAMDEEKYLPEHPDYVGWRTYEDGMKVSGSLAGLLGVKIMLTPRLSLLVEGKGDLLFTDEFDAHHGYPTGAHEKATWVNGHKYDALWTIAAGAQFRPYDFSKFTVTSSKYTRKNYLRNRASYERNQRRLRRR